MRPKHGWLIAVVVMVMVAAGCGGDDDGTAPTSAATVDAGDGGSPGGDDQPATGGGSGGGELVLGDETITLDSARCFLQEQDAAGGGGKILFVGQGFGTNAAGEELIIDVSRYDEDSQFTGDDILVDIGEPFSEDAVSLVAGGDIGTVTLNGSTLSADGLTFRNFDDGTEVSGSFRIDC